MSVSLSIVEGIITDNRLGKVSRLLKVRYEVLPGQTLKSSLLFTEISEEEFRLEFHPRQNVFNLHVYLIRDY